MTVKVPVLAASGVASVTVTAPEEASVNDASDRRVRMCEKCVNPLSATAGIAPGVGVAVELTTATTADPSACLGGGSVMMPATLFDGGRKDSATAATAATAAVTTWPSPSWRVTGSMFTTLTAVEAEGCSGGNAGTTAGSRTTAAAAIVTIVASNGTGELSDFCSAPLLSVLAPVVVVKVPAVAKADRGY